MTTLTLHFSGRNNNMNEDLACLMERVVPPSWQALTWPIADLDAWAHAMLTAQMQLVVWARDGYCKSYYLPSLLQPHAFLTAVKLHQVGSDSPPTSIDL